MKHRHQTVTVNNAKLFQVHPAGGVYLQDLDDLQLGVHHHHILVVRQEVSFPVAQGRGGVGEAVWHTSTHNHLSHHFPNSVDRTQDIVA